MSSRGRKPLDKSSLHARVSPQTPMALRKKAQEMGYEYGKSGATGELLDAIAEGRLVLVKRDDWENIKKLVANLAKIDE